MKKRNQFNAKNRLMGFRSIFIIVVLMTGFVFTASSQSASKGNAEMARLKTQVERARVAHDKLQQKIHLADSLIAHGTEMREESSAEIKTATTAMKARNKEYSTQRKSLEKRLKSKSREDVAEAKAEIKTLDTEYKADLKAHDILMKAQTKKSADGTKNLDKGKAMKKDSGKAFKEAAKNLENAQFALDEAVEAAEYGDVPAGKKGKKKK